MRLNIFDENNQLIGVDYQRENLEWMHKWIDWRTGKLERGAWRGRAQGDRMKDWKYEEVKEI